MGLMGILLIVLCAPLLIGYFIGEKKSIMWRNLGIVMGAVGLLIMVAGQVAGF